MSSEQVSEFVFEHRHTVREFDFENVILINGDSWEDALAPLTDITGSDEWLSQQSGSETGSFSSFPSQEDIYQFDCPEVIDTQASLPLDFDAPSDLPRSSVLVTKVKKERRHRRRRRKHTHKAEKLEISDPILASEAKLDMLQPTVFNPTVQGVQRNVQQEAAQQELADDPEKRVSTLKKAREAVLKQLGREFSKTQERKEHVKGFFKNTCSASRKGRLVMNESTTALVPLMFSRY
jgi:hypothetical protein